MPLSKEQIQLQPENLLRRALQLANLNVSMAHIPVISAAMDKYAAERAQLLVEALEIIEGSWDGSPDGLSQSLAIDRMITVAQTALHNYRNNLK